MGRKGYPSGPRARRPALLDIAPDAKHAIFYRKAARPTLPSAREYLARGMEELEEADTVRLENSPVPAMGGVFGWPRDHERWLTHLGQAEADFRTILDRFPASPEAAEARFMLGRINDHPYRNRFDDALEEYRRTVSEHPGTKAAEKARDRIAIILAIRG